MQPDSNNQLLDVLTHEGVLINVSVRYWRATKKLKAEDLGLDPDCVSDRLISLGHKKLLPKESLQPFALIEGRAHALIEADTFVFLNGLSHFLPNAKLEEVTGRLDELRNEFELAKADFLSRYEELREQALHEWAAIAPTLVPEPERLLATIEVSFPARDRMERSFSFEVALFQIRVPERLDLTITNRIEQEEIQTARARAAEAAAEQIRRGAEAFVTDCVASLRQQTAQLCDEMLESMRTCKTGVHQKTLNRLVRFIDQFKSMNFVGDRQMEEQLERVRQEFLVRSAEEYRDDAFARSRLEQGLQGLADTARDLARQDSQALVTRFGEMGRRRFNLAA